MDAGMLFAWLGQQFIRRVRRRPLLDRSGRRGEARINGEGGKVRRGRAVRRDEGGPLAGEGLGEWLNHASAALSGRSGFCSQMTQGDARGLALPWAIFFRAFGPSEQGADAAGRIRRGEKEIGRA